jgi:SUF system NifU family Fe-S assembly protein
MSDAMQLYQSIVLDHNRSPRGLGRLMSPTHEADGFNPICGDRVTLTINARNNTIEKVGFLAESCALCRASASVLVDTIEGLNVERANELSRSFASMLSGGRWELGGDAAVFSVRVITLEDVSSCHGETIGSWTQKGSRVGHD